MLHFANKLNEEDFDIFSYKCINIFDKEQIHSHIKSRIKFLDDIIISNFTIFSHFGQDYEHKYKHELHFFDFNVENTDKELPISQEQQFLINYDWQKFLYSKLSQNDKMKYLDNLKNYLQTHNLSDVDIKNYIKEIELNIPYGSINFYKAHKKEIQDFQDNGIAELIKLQNRRNELIQDFETFEFDPTKPIKKQTYSYQQLSYSTINKLQKKLIMLCNLGNEQLADKFIDYLVTSYFSEARQKIVQQYNYKIDEQDIQAKLIPAKDKAEDIISRIIQYPKELEEELYNKYKDYITITEKLNNNKDLLDNYCELQFKMLENNPTKEALEILKLAKIIEKDEKSLNTKIKLNSMAI